MFDIAIMSNMIMIKIKTKAYRGSTNMYQLKHISTVDGAQF